MLNTLTFSLYNTKFLEKRNNYWIILRFSGLFCLNFHIQDYTIKVLIKQKSFIRNKELLDESMYLDSYFFVTYIFQIKFWIKKKTSFLRLCTNLTYLGAHRMTATPAKQMNPPIQSYKSGIFPSIPQPHKIARMIKTPP